jgi:hypothetical protein
VLVVRLLRIERSPNRRYRYKWLCKCDCGNEAEIRGDVLRQGGAKSCGCLSRELSSARQKTNPSRRTHGEAHKNRTPEYRAWVHMINRCENEADDDYPLYGGRGISICERWRRGDGSASGYELFLADMGRRPSSSHSIDRVNTNGNYEPTNTRWATPTVQVRNRRTTIWMEYRGERIMLVEAAERFKIPYGTLLFRKRNGWPDERAIDTPVRARL